MKVSKEFSNSKKTEMVGQILNSSNFGEINFLADAQRRNAMSINNKEED